MQEPIRVTRRVNNEFKGITQASADFIVDCVKAEGIVNVTHLPIIAVFTALHRLGDTYSLVKVKETYLLVKDEAKVFFK